MVFRGKDVLLPGVYEVKEEESKRMTQERRQQGSPSNISTHDPDIIEDSIILDQPELRCPRGHIIKDNLDREAEALLLAVGAARERARKALKREPTNQELADFMPAIKNRRSNSQIACEECSMAVVIEKRGVSLQGRQEALDLRDTSEDRQTVAPQEYTASGTPEDWERDL